MKLKKKVKRNLIIFLILLIAIIVGTLSIKFLIPKDKEKVKEYKVLDKLDKYGYQLKENKTKKYKEMFNELKEILNSDKVDEEKYAEKISEMFIYDFYSLEDKAAKTDIGGVDFIYQQAMDNFLQTAQNTYYKYVESNIYNDRNQKLPVVGEITVNKAEKKPYAYGEKTDNEAYYVPVTWTYTDETFQSYQSSATIILIHDENKLSIVELQ